jgi:pimeloyl-ACP methyl ester carboxylesterase
MKRITNYGQAHDRQPIFNGRRVAISLLLMAGMTICGGEIVIQAQDRPESQASVTNPGDLPASFHAGGLKFLPCLEDPGLECGRLTLPIDYSRPSGEKFNLAVIRAKATMPDRRIGVLMTNPGGPGLSGVDFLLAAVQDPFFARLRERFDIVSFDPRGVGRSRPVRCEFDGGSIPAGASDEALAVFFDNFSRRFKRSCLEQNGRFITLLGTNQVARDMDALRLALGESQISYAGGSYGTLLGAVYASLFPQRVRAMVLDGGVTPEFQDYFVETWAEFSTAHEVAFQRLDQLCRRDSACRLNNDGPAAVLDEIVARLKTAPVTSPEGSVLTGDAVTQIVASLLISEANWLLIVEALANAQLGDYEIFFLLLPTLEASSDALFPVLCNDHGTRRPAAEYLPVDETVGASNPRFFGRFFVASMTARCTAWPQADVPVIRQVSQQLSTPILLVGNDFDPKTPLAGTRRLARALGMESSVIRYRGSGHTIVGETECIDNAVEGYLEHLTLPGAGFSCPALPILFDASIARNAARNVPAASNSAVRKPANMAARRYPLWNRTRK